METTVTKQPIRQQALEAKWAAEAQINDLRERITRHEAAGESAPSGAALLGLMANASSATPSQLFAEHGLESLRAQLQEQERRLDTMNHVIAVSEARARWSESAPVPEQAPAVTRFLRGLTQPEPPAIQAATPPLRVAPAS